MTPVNDVTTAGVNSENKLSDTEIIPVAEENIEQTMFEPNDDADTQNTILNNSTGRF